MIDFGHFENKIASAIAHRACCGTENNPSIGKLHGYCVVCGVPWPCDTAKAFLAAAPAQDNVQSNADSRDAARYRWIRDTASGAPASSEFWPGIELDLPSALDEEWCASILPLDTAIDAAIEADQAHRHQETP